MYYQIEAVRWGTDGHISHVRWQPVTFDGSEGVHRAPAQVVPVVDAASVCDSKEVRVYVEGGSGRFFRMKGCAHGIDAEVDEAGTPLRQRMAHLPTF